MEDDELSQLLHAATPAPLPSAEELEAILARHGHGWRRVVAATAAIAVITSGTVALVAHSSGRATQQVTARPLGPTQLAEALATQPSPPAAGRPQVPPVTFERLFLRTTSGGVTMRVYLGALHGLLPCTGDQRCPPPECLPHTIIHVGLSTDTAVGELAVPADGPSPPVMALVGATGFGLPGVSANFALVVRTGAKVKTLRMGFANGDIDQMAPVGGWAVLAHQGGPPFGTLEALDAAGSVIASTPIPPQRSAGAPQPGQNGLGGQPSPRCRPPAPGGAAGQAGAAAPGGFAPGGVAPSGGRAT